MAKLDLLCRLAATPSMPAVGIPIWRHVSHRTLGTMVGTPRQTRTLERWVVLCVGLWWAGLGWEIYLVYDDIPLFAVYV